MNRIRKPEVDQLDLHRIRDDNIIWFDIAMHDFELVAVPNRFYNLLDIVLALKQFELPPLFQQLPKRLVSLTPFSPYSRTM